MGLREQYKKETGKEALGAGEDRNHCESFFTDEYVAWVEDQWIEEKITQAIGWTYAELCVRVDNGEDILKINVPVLLDRAQEDGIIKHLTKEKP